MAQEDIGKRLQSEVEKRVEYYEQNKIDDSQKMGKIHYILAVVIAAIGLAMTILGAVVK